MLTLSEENGVPFRTHINVPEAFILSRVGHIYEGERLYHYEARYIRVSGFGEEQMSMDSVNYSAQSSITSFLI